MTHSTDLMFGCLGNGVTVCNRSRMDHGDYMTVAHIDPCGAYKLYAQNLPEDAKAQIARHAAGEARRFRQSFDRLRREAALDMVYERMTVHQQLERRDEPLWQMSRPQLYDLYIRIVCENEHRIMP